MDKGWGGPFVFVFLSAILVLAPPPQLLCRVIVNCPHKTLVCACTITTFPSHQLHYRISQRERSMKMLLDFINLFDTPGTHKLYKLASANLCFNTPFTPFLLV